MIGISENKCVGWIMLERLRFHPLTAPDLGNVPSAFKSYGQTGEIIHLDPRVIVNFVYKHLLLQGN